MWKNDCISLTTKPCIAEEYCKRLLLTSCKTRNMNSGKSEKRLTVPENVGYSMQGLIK